MLCLEDLHLLAEKFQDSLQIPVREFEIGGKAFGFNSTTHLMGVINLSPDSWYRESVCLNTSAAIQRGRQLIAEGADIVDLGAESSILTAVEVDSKNQLERLLPVIHTLVQEKIPISIETYHFKVAKSCLKAGASLLNFTGTTSTTEIFKLVAEHNASIILCYVEGENVRSVTNFSLAEDMIPPMYNYFSRKIEEALSLGVKKIIIDPGLGFYYRNLQDSALRVRHQMKVFLNTFRLRKLGWPICHALPHAFEFFEDEVRSAESFFAVLALLGKTSLLRTHEIKKVRGVYRTLETW